MLNSEELETLREILDKDDELSKEIKEFVLFIAQENLGKEFIYIANMLQEHPLQTCDQQETYALQCRIVQELHAMKQRSHRPQ